MNIHAAIKALVIDVLLRTQYRVYVSKTGTYGYYTDTKGQRVVSFYMTCGDVHFTGNYQSHKCGTGWQLQQDTYENMFNANPPQWATQGERVKLCTQAMQQARYQWSSGYREVVALNSLQGTIGEFNGATVEVVRLLLKPEVADHEDSH